MVQKLADFSDDLAGSFFLLYSHSLLSFTSHASQGGFVHSRNHIRGEMGKGASLGSLSPLIFIYNRASYPSSETDEMTVGLFI